MYPSSGHCVLRGHGEEAAGGRLREAEAPYREGNYQTVQDDSCVVVPIRPLHGSQDVLEELEAMTEFSGVEEL